MARRSTEAAANQAFPSTGLGRQRKFALGRFRAGALPPTTTIRSLPRTAAVRRMRSALRHGHITTGEYETFMRRVLERDIRFQVMHRRSQSGRRREC